MPETPDATTIRIQLHARPADLAVVPAIGLIIASPDGPIDVADSRCRLAIDEIVTLSVLDAIPDSAVDCELQQDRGEVTIRVNSLAAREIRFSPHPLSWHMLRSLTASPLMSAPTVYQGSFDESTNGYPTVIGFTCKREVSHGTRTDS